MQLDLANIIGTSNLDNPCWGIRQNQTGTEPTKMNHSKWMVESSGGAKPLIFFNLKNCKKLLEIVRNRKKLLETNGEHTSSSSFIIWPPSNSELTRILNQRLWTPSFWTQKSRILLSWEHSFKRAFFWRDFSPLETCDSKSEFKGFEIRIQF